MQIGEAFQYVFQDKKWIEKIVIAAVLILTIVGAVAVAGWIIEIMRRVIRRDPEPLAPWNALGQYFVDGLKVIAIGFIWMLPFTLLSMCLGMFSGLAGALGGDSNATQGMSAVLSLCLTVVSLPYSLIVSFLLPPMYGVLAMGATFGEALNPARAWRLAQVNLGGFVIAWLLALIVGSLAGMIGIFLCVVGVFLLVAYASAVTGHLYGQASREAMANLPAA
ncbi:MAG TPA: DUF4013 domain-containing protein [Anaerolineales bacterium]|nr:DUF4013 domain-containing protein [Anaerolineales bacterium]